MTLGALLFSAQVAPLVFDALPEDRALAGRIAGRAFTGAYWIALVAAAIALAVICLARSHRIRGEIVLGGSMALASILQLFWIAPAIARHGVGWPWSFASLHGAGGAIHVILSVVSLILAWQLLANGPRPSDVSGADRH
jgi:hypothetical protein